MQALRYKNVKGYGCTIFRRNHNQIFAQGGLWDDANNIYGRIKGATPRIGRSEWVFRNEAGELMSKVSFAHIERDAELHSWQGSQICAIGFDELTHFSEKTFFYMLSRNRSKCGVQPYIRATCNPDADSWVAKFISWWIDQDSGYPIPSRSGKLRYFIRRDEIIHWANTRDEICSRFNLVTEEDRRSVLSVTFIASKLDDNKELLKINPTYKSNLEAMSQVERERLLYGNWKIKASNGMYFRREQVGNYFEVLPDDVTILVRCWDLAATSEDENGNAAYTAGVLMGKRKNGRYVVLDVQRKQLAAADVRNLIRLTAQTDRAKYKRVRIRLPQDPGQAGKAQAQSFIKYLAGFDVTAVAESGSKESRAEPMAAQWQAGNFDLMVGDWNEPFLLELENFPVGKWKDQVDAAANAFSEIEIKSQFDVGNLI